MRSPVPMLLLLALATMAAVPPAMAAEKSSKKGSDVPALYRYRNDQGVLVMERSIPPEYTTKGYEVLNAFGQVIQKVEPVTLLTDEQRKALSEQEKMSSRKDSELRKLYSSPQDAERLRDRQLEALGLKIDHAKGQLSQTTAKRKTAVEEAARMERAGNKVPPAKIETIAKLTAQTNAQEQEIKSLQQEQARIREQFDPIIGRLRVIYPDKAGAVPAQPAGPAAPPVGNQPVAGGLPAGSPPVPAPAPVVAKPAPITPSVPAQQAPGRTATALPVPAPAPMVAKPAVAPLPASGTPPVKPGASAVVAPPAPGAANAMPPAATPAKPVAAPPPVAQPKPLPPAQKPVAAPAPAPKPAAPAVPVVAPVTKVQVKPKPADKASTEEEKAAAKAKAKAEMGLEDEPRSAGGLRPTGF